MDPIEQAIAWWNKAKRHQGILEPSAASLATLGEDRQPSVRIILVKTIDQRGFAFYTNMHSRKSRELKQHPQAALCFHWMPLRLQLRVEGVAELVGKEEADAYFATRPRESRIGAWSSKQSESLASREELVQAVAETTQKFAGADVPRPEFWSGWRIVPARIEFWQEGENRLHERELFTKKGQGWEKQNLYP